MPADGVSADEILFPFSGSELRTDFKVRVFASAKRLISTMFPYGNKYDAIRFAGVAGWKCRLFVTKGR